MIDQLFMSRVALSKEAMSNGLASPGYQSGVHGSHLAYLPIVASQLYTWNARTLNEHIPVTAL